MDPRTPAEIQRPAGLDDPAAQDADPQETREWLDALASVIAHSGSARAAFLLDRLVAAARPAVGVRTQWFQTPYVNTIAPPMQPAYPGDLALEQRIVAAVRWNALAMVVRANRESSELGGHIASYASSAELFEAGFLHHFHGPREGAPGDLVFFQPHSAPGVYARAYLEGRLREADLAHYRREVQAPAAGARGLSSYPHPWLMPDFWQFPTGSMGLGPLQAIYQARFMKYLEHRSLLQAGERKVWGFFGDGEMDEPESVAALTLAARERVDNLVFVVNCNLQRLDGPVRGNGQIVQELEALFAGAGWNVIKVLWGSDWDALFARDASGALPRAFAAMVDGEFQTLSARDGRYNREHFFQRTPELAALVADWSDAQIERLHRGGHDLAKIHAAFAAARSHRGQPTVVLAKTMKGYGMGAAGQGLNITHQQKKLERAELLAFRDRFGLPLSDEQVERLEFWRPAPESAEMRHLTARRAAMGGALPARCTNATPVHSTAGAPAAASGPSPPPQPLCRCSPSWCATRSSARAWFPSWPTRRAPSACRRCSARSASMPPRASATPPKTRARCCTTERSAAARSSRRASPKPVRWPRGSPPERPTARTAWPCCRCSSTTPCSASSAWAI